MKFRRGFALNMPCEDREVFRRVQEIGQKLCDVITAECKPTTAIEGMSGLDCTTAALATMGALHTIMAAAAQVFDDKQFDQLKEQLEHYSQLLCEHHPIAAAAASQAVKSS